MWGDLCAGFFTGSALGGPGFYRRQQIPNCPQLIVFQDWTAAGGLRITCKE